VLKCPKYKYFIYIGHGYSEAAQNSRIGENTRNSETSLFLESSRLSAYEINVALGDREGNADFELYCCFSGQIAKDAQPRKSIVGYQIKVIGSTETSYEIISTAQFRRAFYGTTFQNIAESDWMTEEYGMLGLFLANVYDENPGVNIASLRDSLLLYINGARESFEASSTL
jgi:hypothetical protein